MSPIIIKSLKDAKIIHIFLVFALVAEIITAIIVSAMSILFHGKIGYDFIITGVIAAFAATMGVTSVTFYLLKELRKNDLFAEMLAFNKKILNASSIGILSYNASGQCIFANEAAAMIFGTNVAGLLSGNFHQIRSWKESGIYEVALKALNTDIEQQTEAHVVTTFGKDAWLNLRFSSFNSKGEKHLLLFAHDITERKQAADKVKASEEKYRALVETTATGYLILDGEGKVVDANAEYVRLSGHRELSEILGRSVIEWTADYEKQKNAEAVAQCARDGFIRNLFIDYVDTNGRITPIEIDATAIGSGESLHILSLCRDITERKLAEQELKRSNAELEQFSYAISHDMRQPLRMISSYLGLLEKRLAGQLDGENREFFNFAIDGAQRLDKMLVALLDYSRVGRKGEPPAWIESRALLDEALLFLQPAIAEAEAKVTISGDWPRVFVSRDEMMRLIQNLIGNAVKYRVAGRKPEIIVTSEAVGNEWRLSVADNGVGILPDQAHRLFQVFQRLHTHTAYEGTGIGLALCRKIAEHHGGKIEAESAGEGQGSTFRIRLPINREDSVNAVDKA